MRSAVLAGVLVGAFAGLFLVAEDIALVIAAVVVGGAWVRLVLLGDGWAPVLDPTDRRDT